ncbi:MAG: glycine--tRNA ligase subunit beta [Myxococcaceae bacterium]|nr:glycine--tRNA ligase subunit beta [Myxococcaceae bacterium]
MPSDLLFELGSEELPASFVAPALEDLVRVITTRAADVRLTHGEVVKFGTPRRLAVWVKNVADQSSDVVKDVQGPSVKAAFDKDGKPTQAAEKFAASVKRSVAELKRVQTPKGEYLAAQVEEKGKRALELLPDILYAAAHGIAFKKSMRWGDVDLAYGRPLHWIVALLGNEVVPVMFADVKSGRQTRGHRFLAPALMTLESPAAYEAALEKAHVVADIAKRRALVVDRVRAAAHQAGGKVLEDDALYDQVTQLVEQPSPVVGAFEARHLDLPPEVLIQEMKSHQRYFSLLDSAGKLLPKFIAVSNTPVKEEALSVKGYERVLKARLSDGRFFFDEDRRTKLEERLPKLERVVWQGKLGSYAEKVKRFGALAQWLAEQSGRSAFKSTVARAAQLAKADLVTGMVGEFPELQGVMGREYALADKEPKEVALAIFEHYLPRNASDMLPTQDAGALVGLADRLDTLCGIFAIGKGPTGAADPFGLRRAAVGLIHLIVERNLRFNLSAALEQAVNGLVEQGKIDLKARKTPLHTEVLDFIKGRVKSLWGEGQRADVVDAVLAVGIEDLVAAKKRLEAVTAQLVRPEFLPLAATFKRVANIVEKQAKEIAPAPVDEKRLLEEAEKALAAEVAKAKSQVAQAVKADDYRTALITVAALKPTVDAFFDKVMVMADDKALKENRVRLLMAIRELFGQVADFSLIQVG